VVPTKDAPDCQKLNQHHHRPLLLLVLLALRGCPCLRQHSRLQDFAKQLVASLLLLLLVLEQGQCLNQTRAPAVVAVGRRGSPGHWRLNLDEKHQLSPRATRQQNRRSYLVDIMGTKPGSRLRQDLNVQCLSKKMCFSFVRST
jgi:hypothetical protein